MTEDVKAKKRQDYIRHIYDAVEQSTDYINGFDKDAFFADRRTQQAVIMNLIIIGEAATRLMTDYPELVERYPELPWRNMRGMRNRIAHGYFDLDLELIWQTVTGSLPDLKARLSALI